MTTEHDALHDLLAPVALGAADPTEIARVEAHATRCPICREELGNLRAGAAMLAADVPQEEPSPRLKASLMSTVRAEAAERAAEAETASPPTRTPVRAATGWSWRRLLAPGPAIAIACSLVVLLVGLTIVVQNGSDAPSQNVASVTVSGTSDAPGVTGRMVYVSDEGTAIVNLSNLPPLSPGEAYQLWVLHDGTASSAGLLESTGPSDARGVATGLARGDAVAVTAQPRTNRTTPQGPILVQAAVPA